MTWFHYHMCFLYEETDERQGNSPPITQPEEAGEGLRHLETVSHHLTPAAIAVAGVSS